MKLKSSGFAVISCQVGTEHVLQREVLGQGWRLAFSRRGLVSFKCVQPTELLPKGIFVRTAFWGLGLIKGNEVQENLEFLIGRLREIGEAIQFDRFHIWPRDRAPVGHYDFEPGDDRVIRDLGKAVENALLTEGLLKTAGFNRIAEPMHNVLDLVLVDPFHWAVGWHSVPQNDDLGVYEQTISSMALPMSWPGGVQPLTPSGPVVSRAYFKAAEAIAWSRFDIRKDQVAIEIGASPGGASERLLHLGLHVIGIDPAEICPKILNHPSFHHIKARAGDLPRRVFTGADWLFVDSNVRPQQTLTTVENIVTHRGSTLKGFIITLKLPCLDSVRDLPTWISRIKDCGARDIKIRQLARGKMELCMAGRLDSVS